MATVAELETKIANLKSRLARAEAALTRQEQVLESNLAEAARFTEEAATYPEGSALRTRTLEQAAAQTRNAQAQQSNVARAQAEITGYTQQLAEAEQELATAKAAAAEPPPPPPQSAAADVSNSAAGATQNPATPPTSTGRLTTDQAATLASNTETGTNPPVKTLTETQSVDNTRGLPIYNEEGTLATSRRNPETGELYTPLEEGRPGGEPGVGAKGDDGVTATNTQQIISAATVGQRPFLPKNNVLDQYASYTYNIGWYLLTPEQYTALQKTSKITVSQYNLLIQSGGAPTGTTGVQSDLITNGAVAGAARTAGRNPFFELDYYFDNLEIKSTITGKGSNRAHNATELSFTVTETAGITLIDNLYKAVQSVYKNIPEETVNGVPYVAAYYALIIRFYGYDQDGKIVQASDSDNNSAVVEKIIPFRLSDINFSVSNRLVEYQIKATAIPYSIGFGSNLGVIKADIEISGATVKDLLTKGVALAEVSPPDGRQTTTTPAKPATPPAAPRATLAVNDISASAGVDALGNFTGETASPFAVVAP